MKNPKLLKFSILLFLSCFLLHSLIIITDGLSDDNQKADFAIILGTTVNKDGSISERLKARLDRALELHQDKLVDSFYVSGGLGKEGRLEGTKMAEYLIQNGISSSKVFIDNQGNTTQLTARNFRKDFQNSNSVVVVSQYFHISRCKLAMRKVGVKEVSGASPYFFEWRDFYSVFREFFGYYVYWFKNF